MGTCCWSKHHERHAWNGFRRTCAAVIMAGKISVRLMRMARNALLPKSRVAGVVKGDHLGAMEYTRPTDVAFGRRVDRIGLLRRLRKNYPAERRGNTLACETLGPGRPGAFHRLLSVARPLHEQIDYRDYGAVLQISSPHRSGDRRAGLDGNHDRRKFQCGQLNGWARRFGDRLHVDC